LTYFFRNSEDFFVDEGVKNVCRKIHSHRGKFTVLSLSEAGYKQPVGVGLELDDPSDAMTKV